MVLPPSGRARVETMPGRPLSHIGDPPPEYTAKDPPPYTAKPSRIRPHLRKYRWFYVAAVVVAIALVVSLPMVFVYYPRHVQASVSNGAIIFTSLSIPYTRSADGFYMNMTARWATRESQNPHLDPWLARVGWHSSWTPGNDLDTPFVLAVPRLDAYNGSAFDLQATVTQNNYTSSFNSSDFMRLVSKAVALDPISLILSGTGTSARDGGLSQVSVNYEKQVRLLPDEGPSPSPKDYPGVRFDSLQQNLGGLASVNATLISFNNRNVTVDFRNVGASLETQGLVIGTAILKSAVLRPGYHNYSMEIMCNLTAIESKLRNPSPAYGCGKVIGRLFNASSTNDMNEPTWFNEGINNLEIYPWIDVAPAYNLAGLGRRLDIACKP